MLLMPRLLSAVLDLLMEEDAKTQPWVYYGVLLVCLSNMDLGWFGSWRILPILTINIHQLHLSQDPLLAPGLSCLERMAMFTGNVVCQHPPWIGFGNLMQFGFVPETKKMMKQYETCKIMMKAKHVEISTLRVSWQISGCRSPIPSKITPTHFFPPNRSSQDHHVQ